MKKRILAMALALVLVAAAAVAGTVAWLMDKTEAVENTFTVGDVKLTLKESVLAKDNGNIVYDTEGNPKYNDPAEKVTNQYLAIPGETYKKDPVVTVEGGNEECYLFVKFEFTEDASTYYFYESMLTTEEDWIKLESGTGYEVWYRTVAKNVNDTSYSLLKPLKDIKDLATKDGAPTPGTYPETDTLAVNYKTVTSETADEASAQYLKYTAYAVQVANVGTVDKAWELVQTAPIISDPNP